MVAKVDFEVPPACSSIIDEKVMEAVLAVVEPTRLRIITLLAERERLCVGDIASRFTISRPAISHHLKVLKSSGLVRTEKVGQEVFYSVCRSCIVDTLRAVADAIESCCRPRETS
jgi:ArsR family transcriptional regulator, arsenate/arsenite/antimonite-responsive transcriptional repressor